MFSRFYVTQITLRHVILVMARLGVTLWCTFYHGKQCVHVFTKFDSKRSVIFQSSTQEEVSYLNVYFHLLLYR